MENKENTKNIDTWEDKGNGIIINHEKTKSYEKYISNSERENYEELRKEQHGFFAAFVDKVGLCKTK